MSRYNWIPKEILVALFALVILIFLSLPPSAQAQSCFRYVSCSIYAQNGPCLPLLPPTAFNCGNSAPFAATCEVPTTSCAPPSAPDETCPTCGKGDSSSGGGPNGAGSGKPSAGHPISLATGNTYIEQTDISIPGLSGGLTLDRRWNSKWPSSQSSSRIGLFGPNWRSNYEERVFVGNDGYMKYGRGDGSFWSLGWIATSGSTFTYGMAAPANVSATLTNGSSYWTITFQNGEQRLFDNTSGNLTTIIDRNGNQTQLSYDASGRLTTVTDPVSRHLFFTYVGSSALVTGVSSDVGLSLSYSYDNQGRLSQVTKPDQSFISFDYNAQSLIQDVKDSRGKILESHTYDAIGRGLTSSKAGGVDSLTITYPQ